MYDFSDINLAQLKKISEIYYIQSIKETLSKVVMSSSICLDCDKLDLDLISTENLLKSEMISRGINLIVNHNITCLRCPVVYFNFSLETSELHTFTEFTTSSSGEFLRDIKIIWYGVSVQGTCGDSDAADYLRNKGYTVEKRDYTQLVENLNSTLLVIAAPQHHTFNSTEANNMINFVNNGNVIIFLADTDTDYDPPWGLNVTENFGFHFEGQVDEVNVIPASGYENHPIWTTPNALSYMTTQWDGTITSISDPLNVKVVGVVGSIKMIVLNENPAWNGGRVLGTGYNVMAGCNEEMGQLTNLIDNFVTYALGC